MSTCTHGRTLFWGPLPSIKREGNVALMADAQWLTWTARVGWHVLGLASLEQGAEDIMSVDRCQGSLKRVAAAMLRNGQIVLLQWPCPHAAKGFEKRFPPCAVKRFPPCAARVTRSFAAHSREPGLVRFSCNDQYVVSVGGPDLAVMVWRHVQEQPVSDSLIEALIARVSPHLQQDALINHGTVEHDKDGAEVALKDQEQEEVHRRIIAEQRQRYVTERARGLQGPRGWKNIAQKMTGALLQRPDQVLVLETVYGCRLRDSAANCHFVRGAKGDVNAGESG
jgi:hypothetical protein